MAQQPEGNDTNAWLKQNDLGNLIPKFTESKLTLTKLLACSEDDIRQLCDHFQWNPLIKINLIAAIKSIPSAAANDKKEIVFLGEDAQKILDKLYTKNEIYLENINQIEKAINVLRKSAVECNKEIHGKCDEMIGKIEKYRKTLLNEVETMKNKRNHELEQRLQAMRTLNDDVIKSKNECKKIAIKTDASSSTKLNEMNQIVKENEEKINENNNYNNNQQKKKNCNNFKLTLIYEKNTFKNTLKKALFITFADDTFECKQYEHNNNNTVEILSFDTNFMSANGLQLSDNNKCVKRVGSSAHGFILALCEPVLNDICCWRIKAKNHGHWLLFGVSERKKYTDSSCNDKGVWGVAYPTQTYRDGRSTQPFLNQTFKLYSVAEVVFDMHLDARKGELKYCIVGEPNKVYKIDGLPTGIQNGWVPHFNIHNQNSEIRIARIPPSWFGQQKEQIF